MPRRSSSDARAAILAAAAETFIRDGYASATLEEVGAAVGMTRAAVLYHFQSKEEILREITSPLLDTLDKRLSDIPLREEPTTQQQRDIIECFLGELLEHRPAARLAHRFTTATTALDIGPRLHAINATVLLRLIGTVQAEEPISRVRGVAAIASVVGTVGARISLPLDTARERDTLINCAMCILAPVGTPA